MSDTQPKQQKEPQLAELKSPPEFEKLLQRGHRPIGVFENPQDFQHAQRIAKMLVTSALMPEAFRGEENLGSAVIAVDIAMRLHLNPLMVAQQIYIIHGRPAFSAQMMIGVCNTSADFGKIRYELRTNGEREIRGSSNVVKLEDRVCTAWALEGKEERLPEGVNTLEKARAAGLNILEGPPISMEMAVKEGWYSKAGSKWQTLPDLMLRYRAAAFFVRLFAPELLMGLPTADELEDMPPTEPAFTKPVFGKPATKPQDPPPEAVPPPQQAASPPTIPTPPPTVVTPPEAAQSVPAPAENPIVTLRALCKSENPPIKDEQLINFLKSIRSVKDNVESFEEIQLSDPRVLGMVCEQWSELSKRLKEVK